MTHIINRLCFNHRGDLFAAATDEGVRVYNCEPLTELDNISALK